MKTILIFVLFILFFSIMFAQTAEYYFYSGSQQYIHSKFEEALENVKKGLSIDPNNKKLLKLWEKINEELMKQKQDQDQQSKGNEDQKKKDEEKKNEQQSGQQKKERMKKDKKEEDAEKMLKALLQKEKEEMKKEKQKLNVDKTKSGKYW